MKKGDKALLQLHHTRKLSGAEVFVLDRGSVIDAEAEAMLQALHSRSTGGFMKHLRTLHEKGSENFMRNFYVGYGHKSIGDCGDTTLFIEGVSMLAAKAVQDNPLYSGQEASTRYIDFSKQKMIDPSESWRGEAVLESQRAFYLELLEPLMARLKELHPKPEQEKADVYDKAIKARTFDIARGFLPGGCSTNLAWHSNLRQVADRVAILRHHPLREVRGLAKTIEDAVIEAYPNSFTKKRYDGSEAYLDQTGEAYYFHDPKSPANPHLIWYLDKQALSVALPLLRARPQKSEVPKFLSDVGSLTAEFQLDFGSFRDIQRHRAIKQRMPLLTDTLGFNEWYLEQLPPEWKSKAANHLVHVAHAIDKLHLSPEERQYFIPMGYNVANRFSGDLPSTIYMVELRAKSDVHPTLQQVAHNIGHQIEDELGIPIYRGLEPGRFDTKRGTQDITIK